MRPLLVASLFLALPALAHAYPQVDISWSGCNGGSPVKLYSPTEHVATISVIGADGNFDGFDLLVAVDDRCNYPDTSFPDAWRFDAGGCQSGMLTVTRPRSLDGCPGIYPYGVSYAMTEFGTVKEFYGGPGNAVADVPALLVRLGTAFPMQHFDPATRYVLAQLHFDMTNTTGVYDPAGTLCGCGTAKEEVKLISGSFTPFPPANGMVSIGTAFWNEAFWCMFAPSGPPTLDASASACLPVPAQATTWGQLRASYR